MNFPDFQEEWLERAPKYPVPIKKVLNRSRTQSYIGRSALTALLLVPLFWTSVGKNTLSTWEIPTVIGIRSPETAVGQGRESVSNVFEIIYLKSGQMLKGKILMQKRENLLVHTENTEYIVNSGNIRKIRYFIH